MMVDFDWTQIMIALVTGLFGGGGVATILRTYRETDKAREIAELRLKIEELTAKLALQEADCNKKIAETNARMSQQITNLKKFL